MDAVDRISKGIDSAEPQVVLFAHVDATAAGLHSQRVHRHRQRLRGAAHGTGNNEQALGGDVGAAAVVDERAADVEHHVAGFSPQLFEFEVTRHIDQDAAVAVDGATIGHAHGAGACQADRALGVDALGEGEAVRGDRSVLPAYVARTDQPRLGCVNLLLGIAIGLDPIDRDGSSDAERDVAAALQVKTLLANRSRHLIHRNVQAVGGTAHTRSVDLECAGLHLVGTATGLGRSDGAAGHQAHRIGHHLAQGQIAHSRQAGGAVGADHSVAGHGQRALAGRQVHRRRAGGNVHRLT